MHEPSDCVAIEDRSVPSLHTLPCELLVQILKELRSLRQLQAAILGSGSLLSAYQSSRMLVRQQVFRNEFLDYSPLPQPLPEAQDVERTSSTCPITFNFTRAQSRIAELEGKHRADGLILRACLWNDLLARAECESEGYQTTEATSLDFDDDYLEHAEFTKVFTTWSSALTTAQRQANQQEHAMKTETQTLNVLKESIGECTFHSRAIHRSILDWLSSAMASCVTYHQHGAGFVLFRGVWKHFAPVKSKHAFEMIKSLEWFCADLDPSNYSEAHEIEAQAWKFMREHISEAHTDGNFCFNCTSTADSLISISLSLHDKSDGLISYQTLVWRDLPPRSAIFTNWSRLLVSTLRNEGKQLDGQMMIWRRLQESQSQSIIDSYDLDWARDIILGLREDGKKKESLSIQAYVFPRLETGEGQWFAWGRELLKAYSANGQIKEAIYVAETMCHGLPPSSKFYTTWTKELSKLKGFHDKL